MKKILIVDDDPSICETLRLICCDAGYSVETTLTDEEFRTKYLEVQPDIVSIDLNLNNRDGIELLRWLSLNVSRVKIIIVSGYDEKILNSAVVLSKSLDLDIVATLHKPIDTVHLKSILSHLQNESLDIKQAPLDHAIKNNEFLLYYQPMISLETRKLLGVEALINWNVPDKKMMTSESLIAIAEETGFISPLSSLVNEEAIRNYAELRKIGWDIMLSINISAKLLTSLDLPDALIALAQKFNTKPELICIEVTETAAIQNISCSLDILSRLRIKGFSVSIDGFGTGFSSLIKLHHSPCNELKLDKSFINILKSDNADFIIVRAMINLGHELGLRIVAEGVETSDELDILKKLGCDVVQGDFIAKPMPVKELKQWLRDNVDSKMSYQFSVADMKNHYD